MSWTTGIALLVCVAASSACANSGAEAPKAVTSEAARSRPPVAGPAGELLSLTPDNTRIAFVGSKLTGREGGRFEKFTGTVQLVEGSPERSRVQISIDLGSVATDSTMLAEHLRSPDFFDTSRFPKATFVSTDVKPGGDKGATHTIQGNLDLHGVTKSITFPATVAVTAEAAALDAEFAINRKDFGIVYAGRTNDLIRDEVVLKLSVRAPRTRPQTD